MSGKGKEACASCAVCEQALDIRAVTMLDVTRPEQPLLSADKIREIYALVKKASREELGGKKQCARCRNKRAWVYMYAHAPREGGALQGLYCTACHQRGILALPDQYEPEIWGVRLSKAAIRRIAKVDTTLDRVVLSYKDVDLDTLF